MEQNKNQLLPGILNLVILKPLDTLSPLHGYGITRRSITRLRVPGGSNLLLKKRIGGRYLKF
jgi:hypothetical protein